MAGLKAVLGRIYPASQRDAAATVGVGFRRRGFRGIGCVFVHGSRIPNNRGLVEAGVASGIYSGIGLDVAIDIVPDRSEK